MRSDLLRPTRFYDAPVWHGQSGDNEYWHCFLYQVRAVCAVAEGVAAGHGSEVQAGAGLGPQLWDDNHVGWHQM